MMINHLHDMDMIYMIYDIMCDIICDAIKYDMHDTMIYDMIYVMKW